MSKCRELARNDNNLLEASEKVATIQIQISDWAMLNM